MRKFVAALVSVVLICSCETEPESLFTLLDTDDTNLNFVNQIFESDQINIMELEYVYNGGGVSIGDFNNDGLQDLFFTGNMVPNKLFLNKGELEFEDISEAAGIGGFYKWKSGSALVDINSDGKLDIYVCATISGDSTLRRNMLFVNQGVNEDGIVTFEDRAADYGVDFTGYSSNAAFLDADNDGDLDLYILTNSRQPGVAVSWRPKINDGSSSNTDKLFRNNGDGTFTDVSFESGIICEGYGLGVGFQDINRDGWTDIYVSNDYITNDILYINQKDGTFRNEIDKYIKHQSKFSMGNDIADINNDGYPDIITVDMLPETNFRKKTVLGGVGYISYINDAKFGYAHQYIRNMLQLNNGDDTFGEIGQLAGVYQTEWSWAPLFADFNNDGFRDLIVTNGFPRDVTDRDFISYRQSSHGLLSREQLLELVPSVKVPNSAFRNNGNLTFTEVTKEWGFVDPSFSNGAAYADLDNDGDLDYVVNNINDPVFLYRNNLNNRKSNSSHYIRLKLKGKAGNVSSLGAKVKLYADGKIQFAEHEIYRGYISTVEDFVHFGLGNSTKVDSIIIQWPGLKMVKLSDVPVDQVLQVSVEDAKDYVESLSVIQESLFKNKSNEFSFRHLENDKIDFNIQRTLPRKLSQNGPGIAVGDINNDGIDDFIVGGSASYPAMKFVQNKEGKFFSASLYKDEKKPEDTGLLLFDADNDNDLDLYCVSGSYEFEPGSVNYNDRLYKNDGKGNFILDNNAIPTIGSSGTCVRAADFDQDGDLDLFIGGRTPPGQYPLPDNSYLLRNDNGKLTDVTLEVSLELQKVGMVNDAIWSDFNGDNQVDLIVVGEFMAVTFFENKGGKLSKVTTTGIQNNLGWYNSISGGDFDNDGDIDYLVGNLGLNNYYQASPATPLTICAKDFDGNGSVDAILSCYAKSETGELKSYPIHFWDDLNAQSPKFRQRYNQYKEFAKVTTDEFFSPEELKDAVTYSANYMATSVIMNLGNNKFSITALPSAVQVAPVNGIVLTDLNDDENLDAVVVGNDYGNEPTFGQQDAMTGIVLLGNGAGQFKVTQSKESKFVVDKDAKALTKLSLGKEDMIIATQNRDSLRAYTVKSSLNQKEFIPAKDDVSAILTFSDGKKRKHEFYFGSGYLSQSTRRIRIPNGTSAIEIINSKGQSRQINLSK